MSFSFYISDDSSESEQRDIGTDGGSRQNNRKRKSIEYSKSDFEEERSRKKMDWERETRDRSMVAKRLKMDEKQKHKKWKKRAHNANRYANKYYKKFKDYKLKYLKASYDIIQLSNKIKNLNV